LITQFKDDLEEGSCYVFENFMVGSNDHAYKSTSHKYKFNFMRGTKVFKVTGRNIPASHFSFVPFLEILSASREDRLLGKLINPKQKILIVFHHVNIMFNSVNVFCNVDVIGHVVEKDVIKETEKNGKKSKVMDITLEDLE
jgi:hypothetical protein